MNKTTVLTAPAAATTATAARLASALAVTFLVILGILHLVRPDLDPTWRFISEYAVGNFGFLMVFAFLVLAASYVALFAAVRHNSASIAGRIGQILMLVSAAGLLIAGIFKTDGIMTPPDAMTTSGQLHALGGTLGFAMPFAAVLVSLTLAKNPSFRPARTTLLLAAGLAALGFLASFVSLGLMLSESGGAFGPDVHVGLLTRIEMLTYCIWLIVVARQVQTTSERSR